MYRRKTKTKLKRGPNVATGGATAPTYVATLSPLHRSQTKASTYTRLGTRVCGGKRNTECESGPNVSKGGTTEPNVWPRFVLPLDQKQKNPLAPNSVHGCMLGKGRPSLNMDLMRPQGAPQHLICDLLCSVNRSKTKSPSCTK